MKDVSRHHNTVEYAKQYVWKGKPPQKAAELTYEKLHGQPNMFLGSPVEPVSIDVVELREAVWDSLVDYCLERMSKLRPEKVHYALQSQLFEKQKSKKFPEELERRIIRRLGHDPFPFDRS